MGHTAVFWHGVQSLGAQKVLADLESDDVDYSALSAVASEIETDEDLYDAQVARGLAYTRRQVHGYLHPKDLTELRTFVQSHIGGEHTLWPILQSSGMAFSRGDLRRVLCDLRREEVELRTVALDVLVAIWRGPMQTCVCDVATEGAAVVAQRGMQCWPGRGDLGWYSGHGSDR